MRSMPLPTKASSTKWPQPPARILINTVWPCSTSSRVMPMYSRLLRPRPAGRSRGIALMEGYDTYMAQVAEISVKDNEITVHKIWVVADLGQMVNPDTVQAQLESSIAFGLSSTLGAEITLDKGRVQQTNFHDYPVIRMSQMPRIDVTLVKSTEKPGGIGEPATALVGPVVANALFAATGKRVRKIPLSPDNIKSA